MKTGSCFGQTGLKFMMSISIIALATGCSSSDLSRSDAEALIKEIEKYPQERTDDFTAGKGHLRGFHIAHDPKTFVAELNQSGLARASLSGEPLQNSMSLDIELSKNAEQYIRERSAEKQWGWMNFTNMTVVTYICDINEVTGIAFNENKTFATVEYMETCTPTPFGKLTRYTDARWAQPRKEVVRLQLYDDGWRKL